MQNAFAAAGKYLPRTASQQFAQAPVHVPLSQAQPGDLLVWGSAPGFYHVAIYLGGGRVVQALNEDAGITVTDLAPCPGCSFTRWPPGTEPSRGPRGFRHGA